MILPTQEEMSGSGGQKVDLSPLEGSDLTKKNAVRRLSLSQSERKRSLGKEDAEWLEAEKEQLKIIDPAAATTQNMDTKKKDPVEPGLSVNAERKLSCIGAERRRSLGVEDSEWKEAEEEQQTILVETSGPPSAPLSELGAPSFEEEEGGYSADTLVGSDGPAPTQAPQQIVVTETNGERRASMDAAERRRSLGVEDGEWAEAEAEQKAILQQEAAT